MLKKIVFLILTLQCLDSWAQQTPLYGQYFLNPYLYNPSSAGSGDQTRAFLLYRKQWVGVTGAPETFAFTVDGQLKDRPIGLGLSVVNDVNNIIGRTNFALAGSYTAKLGSDQSLSFGMSAQAIQNRIFFDRIQAEDINDPNLLTSIDQRTAFELGAGLTYRWKQLQIGIASDQLLQNGVTFESSPQFRTLEFSFVRHYVSSLQYLFELDQDFDIEPTVLARVVQGLPTQFDVNLRGIYRDKVWASTAYRHDIGMAFSMGFDIQNQIIIGYSYEIPTTDIRQVGGSSHEIMLGWRFSPSSGQSIPSVPRSVKQKNLKNLERENEVQYQELDELKQRNERISQELQESNERYDQQQEEIDLLKEQLSDYQKEINVIKDQSFREIEDLSDDSKGSFYVVIGAFKTLNSSKRFQQVIRRKDGPETKIIQNETGTFYFIYTQEFQNLSDALNELETAVGNHIADEITGNPWIYFKEID